MMGVGNAFWITLPVAVGVDDTEIEPDYCPACDAYTMRKYGVFDGRSRYKCSLCGLMMLYTPGLRVFARQLTAEEIRRLIMRKWSRRMCGALYNKFEEVKRRTEEIERKVMEIDEMLRDSSLDAIFCRELIEERDRLWEERRRIFKEFEEVLKEEEDKMETRKKLLDEFEDILRRGEKCDWSN